MTSQYPEDQADHTVHQVWGAGPDHQFTLAHTFDGVTRDDEWLTFTPSSSLRAVRYVRLETTETIHWVSWEEIEVISAGRIPPDK
jgi:hypothetical protein